MYGIKKSHVVSRRMSQFEDLIKLTKLTILPVDQSVAERFVDTKIALEKRGARLEDFDLLIAATALASGLTLVTRNKKHFERIEGLRLLD